MPTISFLTNALIGTDAEPFVKIHKMDAIEPDLLVQGEVNFEADGTVIIYPKFTVKVSKVEEKAYPISTITGTTNFKNSREVGKTGVSFSQRVYAPKMDYKSAFIDCIAFDKTATLIQQYAPNNPIELSGKVSFKVWKDKVKLNLTATAFNFISEGKKDQQPATESQSKAKAKVEPEAPAF